MADPGHAGLGEPRLRRGADARDDRDRLVGEEIRGLRAADDREAARLLEIRRDLGEELVVGQPDRDRDADFLLDPPGEARERDGGAAMMQPLRAGEIEKGLVDGDRLHQRRQLQHELAHLAAGDAILLHVRV